MTSTPAARLALILRSSSANRYGGIRSRRLLGRIELLDELIGKGAVEYGDSPPSQRYVKIRGDLDLELAAIEDHLDRGAAAFQDIGYGRSSGAGAAGRCLPHPALEDPGAQAMRLERRIPRDVGAV